MGKNIDETISEMILSASGWRGVFAESGNGECHGKTISEAHKVITALGAKAFSHYLNEKRPGNGAIIVGRDTRPTGEALADAVIRSLIAEGREVRYTVIIAAPEIMAFTASEGKSKDPGGNEPVSGFIYISASHNPIGHNGLKFGLNNGGMIQAEENVKLLDIFRELTASHDIAEKTLALLDSVPLDEIKKVYSSAEQIKKTALKAYYDFTTEVISGESDEDKKQAFFESLRRGIKARPLGITADFNGSARTLSIDRHFFESLGMGFFAINDKPGQIVHTIVPEGESLEPCRTFLDELRKKDPSVIMGYVPDTDGDRGNLVIAPPSASSAISTSSIVLHAQEVFALACLSELALLSWKGELKTARAAIVVNDPTSLRIDRIAQCFGVQVFRAETGEANVVGLARKLREEGFLVRILGEGSAGGTIVHPSLVRDPINTIGSVLKLLAIRGEKGSNGPYELWCCLSGQAEKYQEHFSLSDILSSLPEYHTTGVYTEEALLSVKTSDHGILKDRYQKVFIREWEDKKAMLENQFGIKSWEAVAYNSIKERRSIVNFGEAGRGGLKINFYAEPSVSGNTFTARSSIWMRGSGTEPVFRVVADAPCCKEHDYLIRWQRQMVQEADKTGEGYGN